MKKWRKQWLGEMVKHFTATIFIVRRKGFWEGVSEETKNPNNNAICWGKIKFVVKKFIIFSTNCSWTSGNMAQVWNWSNLRCLWGVLSKHRHSSFLWTSSNCIHIQCARNDGKIYIFKEPKASSYKPFLSNVAWIS